MLRRIQDKISESVRMDTRALSCMRIGIGVILLADLVSRITQLKLYYTDEGLFPVAWMHQIRWEKWYFSIHAWSGSVTWQYLLFGMAILAAVCILLGYFTRLALLISWVLLISLQNRNQLLLNGGDVLLRMLLLWSIFLPLENHFSLRKSKEPESLYAIPALAFTLQLFFVYFSASVLKSQGVWQQGIAIERILSHQHLLSSLGKSFFGISAKWSFLNYLILYAQTFIPFLLFVDGFKYRLRSLALAFLFLFHLAIALFFDLGIFPYVNMVALIGLIPSEWFGVNTNKNFSTPFKTQNPLVRSFVIMLVLVMTLINFQSYRLLQLPRFLNPLVMSLRLDQQWNMFDDNSLSKKLDLDIRLITDEGAILSYADLDNDNIRTRYFISYLPFVKNEQMRVSFASSMCDLYSEKFGSRPESIIMDAHLFQLDSFGNQNFLFEFHQKYPCQ